MKNTTKSIKKSKKNDFVIYLRIPAETYATLQKEAKKDDRTISFMARKALLNGLSTN